MWEIFGALFGGTYLAARFASDKSAKKAANRRFNNYLDIKTQLTNLELESKMRGEMHWGKPYDAEKYRTSTAAIRKMESEIPKEDMEFVFGKDWEKVFYNKNIPYIVYGSGDYFHDIHEIAFNLWLAANKHIISTNHSSGYSFGREIKGLPERSQWRSVPLRACQVIERHIKERYHDAELYYANSTNTPSNLHLSWNFWIDSYRGTVSGKPW